MKCSKCGAELSEDAKFCSACGEKVTTSNKKINKSSKDSNTENKKNSSINMKNKLIRKDTNYCFSIIFFNVYNCI